MSITSNVIHVTSNVINGTSNGDHIILFVQTIIIDFLEVIQDIPQEVCRTSGRVILREKLWTNIHDIINCYAAVRILMHAHDFSRTSQLMWLSSRANTNKFTCQGTSLRNSMSTKRYRTVHLCPTCTTEQRTVLFCVYIITEKLSPIIPQRNTLISKLHYQVIYVNWHICATTRKL